MLRREIEVVVDEGKEKIEQDLEVIGTSNWKFEASPEDWDRTWQNESRKWSDDFQSTSISLAQNSKDKILPQLNEAINANKKKSIKGLSVQPLKQGREVQYICSSSKCGIWKAQIDTNTRLALTSNAGETHRCRSWEEIFRWYRVRQIRSIRMVEQTQAWCMLIQVRSCKGGVKNCEDFGVRCTHFSQPTNIHNQEPCCCALMHGMNWLLNLQWLQILVGAWSFCVGLLYCCKEIICGGEGIEGGGWNVVWRFPLAPWHLQRHLKLLGFLLYTTSKCYHTRVSSLAGSRLVGLWPLKHYMELPIN